MPHHYFSTLKSIKAHQHKDGLTVTHKFDTIRSPDHMQSSIAADRLRERQRENLAARVSNSTNVVLELDNVNGKTLAVWSWCVSQMVMAVM